MVLACTFNCRPVKDGQDSHKALEFASQRQLDIYVLRMRCEQTAARYLLVLKKHLVCHLVEHYPS